MKNILLIGLIGLLLFSCKKKDTAPAAPIIAVSGSDIYGTLQSIIVQSYYGNVFSGSDSSATASFYISPESNIGANIPINAGTVTFNGTTLSRDITNFYYDTTGFIFAHKPISNWLVSGNANVPAINYTYTPNYRTFTANTSLPDSISLSAGVTVNIPISSVSSTDGFVVQISEGSHRVNKSISPSITSCTFSASELSSLNISTSATILLVFSNGTFQTFGGKKYYIDNTLEHFKYNIKLNP